MYTQNVSTRGTKVKLQKVYQVEGTNAFVSDHMDSIITYTPRSSLLTVDGVEYIGEDQGAAICCRGQTLAYNRCLELSLARNLRSNGPDGAFVKEAQHAIAWALNRQINDGRHNGNTEGDISNIVRFVEHQGISVYIQQTPDRGSYAEICFLGDKLDTNNCIFLLANGSHFIPFVKKNV